MRVQVVMKCIYQTTPVTGKNMIRYCVFHFFLEGEGGGPAWLMDVFLNDCYFMCLCGLLYIIKYYILCYGFMKTE